jgi:hypothetical protein
LSILVLLILSRILLMCLIHARHPFASDVALTYRKVGIGVEELGQACSSSRVCYLDLPGRRSLVRVLSKLIMRHLPKVNLSLTSS